MQYSPILHRFINEDSSCNELSNFSPVIIVDVNNVQVSYLLDSGCEISCVGMYLIKQFINSSYLTPSHDQLLSYDNES